MAEPQGDDGTIDASLQEVHGHRVPQTMNSDTLSSQRRAHGRSGLAVFVQYILNAMNAQPLTSGARKQDTLFSALRLFQPASQDCGRRFSERGAAFLAPFANDPQVSARAEEQIVPLETTDLR